MTNNPNDQNPNDPYNQPSGNPGYEQPGPAFDQQGNQPAGAPTPNPYAGQWGSEYGAGQAGPSADQPWAPNQQQPQQQDAYGNAGYGGPAYGNTDYGHADYSNAGYVAPGGYGYADGPGGAAVSSSKGFFGALFDFSFNHFVTPKIIKIVYVVMTALIALGFLGFLIVALFTGDVLNIIGTLIFGPIVAIFYLAIMRMSLEMYYAVIRISEDVHRRLPRQ
ncbi:DUF4282 domain-containing protein [Tessaracoccus sp. OS52]|uniref:DUF4282 domain-containing protein n=1 Tax=Tessaracoccus sp. OS52 TaxID=2886691 RepID=UPI001D12F1C1|nr:DUF4282 domain-containing protein [Tessaracoccus sp. OS52]MCC2594209.1 DUF4282 domain-containing protein [Tessaracoccus sp. OS52]